MTEPKKPLNVSPTSTPGSPPTLAMAFDSPLSTKEPVSPFDGGTSPYRMKSLNREWTRRSNLPEGPIAPRAAEDMFRNGIEEEGGVEEHKPGRKGWLCVLGVSEHGSRK